MKQHQAVLYIALFASDLLGLRVTMFIASLGWALVLVLAKDPLGDTYRYGTMQSLAPAWAWSIAWALHAVALLVAIYFTARDMMIDTRTEHIRLFGRYARILDSALGSLLWIAFAAAFVWSTREIKPGIIAALALAVASWGCLIRALLEYVIEEAQRVRSSE